MNTNTNMNGKPAKESVTDFGNHLTHFGNDDKSSNSAKSESVSLNLSTMDQLTAGAGVLLARTINLIRKNPITAVVTVATIGLAAGRFLRPADHSKKSMGEKR